MLQTFVSLRKLSLVLCSLLIAPNVFAQAASCSVTYSKSWQGGNGYGANLEIRNTGPAVNGWSLVFSFVNGERIQNGWPVTFSQPAGRLQGEPG